MSADLATTNATVAQSRLARDGRRAPSSHRSKCVQQPDHPRGGDGAGAEWKRGRSVNRRADATAVTRSRSGEV